MTSSSPSFDFRIYWEMLWRRKWIVVGSILLSIGIGLYLALNAKPQYVVNASVLLRELDLEINMGKGAMGPRVSATDDMSLLKTKILSPMVLDELIDKVGLLNSSGVTAEAMEIKSSFPNIDIDEIKRNLLIENLKNGILNIRVSGRNIIDIQAQHEDPELAYNLVKTLIDIFISQTQQIELSGLQSGLKYSNEQVQIYKRRLDDAEARLQSFRAGRALNKLDGQPYDELQAENLRTILQTTINQFEIEQRILRNASDLLSNGDALSSISSPEINSLLNRQLAKLGQLVELLKVSDANDDQVFQINKEIKDLDTALQGAVETISPNSMSGAKRSAWVDSKIATLRIRFLERKKQAIDKLLAGLTEERRASLTNAPLRQMTEDRLAQEVTQAREMYQMFLRQKEGAELEKALKDAQSPYLYRLINPPQRPLFSDAMSKRTFMMISCVVGLGLGLGLAFGLEQLDRSLKKIEDVENHLHVPVCGLMPKLEGSDFRFELDSKEAVDVQRIASRLIKQLFRNGKPDRAGSANKPKVIMITSSVMGEGKSTFSAYFAACFAEMLKSTSVLLVDADLRRGIQHKIFKIDNSYGLGNLLEEHEETLRDAPCLQQTEYAKLQVLTSGRSMESPVALFTSEKFTKMLDQLKKFYELIILDTPPVIPVNDALLLSRYADTTLYVVRAGMTPREIAKRGIGLVRTTECHFSGVVMNNMQNVLPYYYRHNYYKYQYENEEKAGLKKSNGTTNGVDVKELVSDDEENNSASDNDKSSVAYTEGLQHAE